MLLTPKIIEETPDYFVINKPAGYAVEPVGHFPSILDWLLDGEKIQRGDWPPDSRFGVVHRLDVDTSGVLIWAKTPSSQDQLKELWQGRSVEKTYIGLVVGELADEEGSVEQPIMRNNRGDKQTVALLPSPKARPAITTYRRLAVAVLDNLFGQKLEASSQKLKISLIEAHPITGRTHQIRVHMKYLGHPIIGDKLYGDKTGDSIAKKLGLTRHFLHAQQLCLAWNGQRACYEAPLPEELVQIITRIGLNQYNRL